MAQADIFLFLNVMDGQLISIDQKLLIPLSESIDRAVARA